MFISGNWANAFINSAIKAGADVNAALETLETLASRIRALPGEVHGPELVSGPELASGSNTALKLEKLIRDGTGALAPESEIALRFILLAIRKNKLKHIDLVIAEITKLINEKQGIVTAALECAFPFASNEEPGEDSDFTRVKLALEKSSGAGKVKLTRSVNPELIGGYRLRIGDKLIDSSIRSQLKKLETQLAGLDSLYGGR